MIKNHRGLLIIQLTDYHEEPGSELETFLHALEERFKGHLKVVSLTISTHRKWAQVYHVHGSPAILIFKDGDLCLRLRGRITAMSLYNLLKERVLEGLTNLQ